MRKGIRLGLLIPIIDFYLMFSSLDCAIYKDYQQKIDINNSSIESQSNFLKKYRNLDSKLKERHIELIKRDVKENIELQKTVDITKNNPLYFPCGLLYDLAEGRR